ncbi:MAG: hypothetical protein J6X49_00915 [Victivallales bacterium]|nr:hypothetical protein [Victivallales bacterium]
MPFSDPEQYGKRRFSPRIIIYPLVLLAAVWFMHKQQKIIEATKEQRKTQPVQKMAVIPVTDSGELKPAGIGNPSAEAKPFLLLVTRGELDGQPWVEELRTARKDQCNIILMNVQKDEGALEFFKLTTTPAAVLRLGSYELGRLTENINPAEINAFLDEKLKKDE